MLLLDEIRMTRDALRYGFAVGKVRVLETKALDRSAIERLLDAHDFGEQKRLLSDTPYGSYLEDARTAEEVERALEDALDGFYRFLDQAELPADVVRFFRARYDFANLKAALKARALGAPTEGLFTEHGTVPAAAFAGDLDELPGHLADVALGLEGESDPALIDAAVDEAYYAQLRRSARASRSAYLESLAQLLVDVANVKTLVRGSMANKGPAELVELLLEGGSIARDRLVALAAEDTADVADALVRLPRMKGLSASDLREPAALDPAMDSLVAAELRRGRHETSGPEPVIAYVMGREAEVRTLRVLLLGTLTGIGFETLRERVRAAFM